MIIARNLKGISCFGGSGSQRWESRDSVLITTTNWLRAEILAEFVEQGKMILHRTIRYCDGREETISYPNPLVKAIVKHRFAYPAEVIATLQAFAFLLESNALLRNWAERDGITIEALEWEIDQVRDYERGGGFDS